MIKLGVNSGGGKSIKRTSGIRNLEVVFHDYRAYRRKLRGERNHA